MARFGLAGTHVVEVGCGSGDFAGELLDAGVGRVTGIDPHLAPERVGPQRAGRLTAVPALFAADQVEPGTAALVCRHTLEHIPALSVFGAELVAGMRRGGTPALLAEVPDLGRILTEGAFWDLQYEHCSYFTPATIARSCPGSGSTRPSCARPTPTSTSSPKLCSATPGRAVPAPPSAELDVLRVACHDFADRVRRRSGTGGNGSRTGPSAGDDVVVWGGGAKGLDASSTSSRAAPARGRCGPSWT